MNPTFQGRDSGTHIYGLTDRGNNELRGAETSLSPAELELLVRIDGSSTVAAIRASVKSLDEQAFDRAFQQILRDRLIEKVSAARADAFDLTDAFGGKLYLQPPQKALEEVKAEAASGAATLKKQGYYVRIARRAATLRKLAPNEMLSVVIIDDNRNVAGFLKQFLAFENYEARIATNREEIIRELRRARPPDLVLLDVTLPDADGFDVLLRMRQHPVLKSVPVVMITAMATREAVLKGLAGGADGYITKPFDADALGKALTAVLGLRAERRQPGTDPWTAGVR